MRKYLLLPLMALFILSACEKEEKDPIYDLYIVQKEYQKPIGETLSVSVHTGNKDYTITPADPDMVTCQVEPEGGSMGNIRISLLKKGTTTIEVKDNVVNQTETLTIHITDKNVVMEAFYEKPVVRLAGGSELLAKEIEEKMTKDLGDKREETFVLIDNERQSYYQVDADNNNPLGYSFYGSYTFEKEDERCFLVFQPWMECGVAPKEVYEFDVTKEYPGFSLLEKYLAVEWVTKDDYIPPYLFLTKNMTSKYREEYPDLEFAGWVLLANVYTGASVPLDWFK